MKKVVLWLFKLTLVVGIFYYLFHSGRFDLSSMAIVYQRPRFFVALVCINLVFIVGLAAWRWKLLLTALNLPLEWSKALLLTFIGNFFNAVLPGSVTGDVLKGYYVVRLKPGEGKTLLFLSLIADRLLGFVGFLWGALLIGFWGWWAEPALMAELHLYFWVILGLGLISFLGLCALLYAPPFVLALLHRWAGRLPLKNFLLKVMESLERLRGAPKLVWGSCALSVLNYGIILGMFWLIDGAYNPAPGPFVAHAVLVVTGLLVITLPLAPGGMGVGHLAFALLYHSAGIEQGAEIFNLYFLALWVGNLCGGIFYLLYKTPSPPDQWA